jgi:hypothetical protein
VILQALVTIHHEALELGVEIPNTKKIMDLLQRGNEMVIDYHVQEGKYP